jgi:hypothetical protein
MTDVEIAADVSALVGAEGLAEIAQLAAAGDYECPACRKPGTAGQDPTSAVVVRAAHPRLTILTLAHAACLPSQIREVARVKVRPAESPQGYMWTAGQSAGPRAPVLLDYPQGAVIGSSSGEGVDLLITGLLEAGMELMTDEESLPPQCGELQAELRGDTLITWQDGTSLFATHLTGLARWRKVAAGGREVLVMAGADVLAGTGRLAPAERSAVFDGGDLRPAFTAAVRPAGGSCTGESHRDVRHWSRAATRKVAGTAEQAP